MLTLKALQINDDLPEAHVTMGKIYEKKGLDTEAVEEYEIAIR